MIQVSKELLQRAIELFQCRASRAAKVAVAYFSRSNKVGGRRVTPGGLIGAVNHDGSYSLEINAALAVITHEMHYLSPPHAAEYALRSGVTLDSTALKYLSVGHRRLYILRACFDMSEEQAFASLKKIRERKKKLRKKLSKKTLAKARGEL